MKIGYPCINLTLEYSGNKTFRLKSYSDQRLIETVENNLDCLLRILEFNAKHKIAFFRISSDLVPFASHPVNTYNWQQRFRSKIEIPRIKVGKKQEIETLIAEEALLFAKYLRKEIEEWNPRIVSLS